MENKKFIEIGGNLEKAEKGDYKLDVVAIFKEGWQLTKTNKQAIVSGLMMILLLGIAFTLTASEYLGGMEEVLKDPQKQMSINLIATAILWPFVAGVEMMGISHAVGIKTRTGFIFAFLKRSAYTALAALIIASITSLGFYLILPGIYLAVALSLTIPLIVEKHMSPTAAIVMSLKATRFQWFNLFKIYSILMSLLIASFIPALLGVPAVFAMGIFIGAMIWLAPLFYNIKGILYREIFGVRMQVVNNNNGNKPETYFSA